MIQVVSWWCWLACLGMLCPVPWTSAYWAYSSIPFQRLMKRRYIKYLGLFYISHIQVDSLFINRLTFFLCFCSTTNVLSDTLLLCSGLNCNSRIALPILSPTLHMGDLSLSLLAPFLFLAFCVWTPSGFTSSGRVFLSCFVRGHPASSHQSSLFRESC